MIDRYTRQQMARIWTEENKLTKWLDIEIAICEAYAQLGLIPTEDLEAIKTKAQFDVKRVQEIEKETKHDVVAFIQSLSESIGPASKWVHMGVTSSDILDTAFSCLLKEAADLLLEDITNLMAVLKEKAFQYKAVPMIGRTHGIHAEPITFGLKMAHFFDEMRRNHERLQAARTRVTCGKISGAVGTYAHVPPSVEAYVCKKLGLTACPISTQIVPRDYYAEFFTTLAIIGSSVEKMATEVRHLQRTEVGEAEEQFTKGQTGSSAMPHKRNPIGSENLSGLGRLLRGYAAAALENIPLWHERDISHSSVERVIGPDATGIADFMVRRAAGLIEGLVVMPERMRKNLEQTGGLYFSEGVMLALVRTGLPRQTAYEMVQKHALAAAAELGTGAPPSFRSRLGADPEIASRLAPSDLDQAFDLRHHLRWSGAIIDRALRDQDL